MYIDLNLASTKNMTTAVLKMLNITVSAIDKPSDQNRVFRI